MTECTCVECVACCKSRPGWFEPGEAEKAAEFLDMTLQAFFKEYLVVDFWVRPPDDIKLLMPRQKSERGGKMLGYWDILPVPCVFLSPTNRCMIHAVKPYECAQALACDEAGNEGWHEKAAMAWDKPEHQQQIKTLLNPRRVT